MGLNVQNIADHEEWLKLQDHDLLVDMACDLNSYLVEQPNGSFEPPVAEFEARTASDLVELLLEAYVEEHG